MSLRGFHLLFITLATILCIFMALWALFWAPSSSGVAGPLLGVIGAAGAIGLPIYGVYFYRKAKKLIL